MSRNQKATLAEVSSEIQRNEHERSLLLKLNLHGFPLRPQPSDDPLDPLNWTRWFKHWVLFQVSLLTFLAPFTSALVNAAFAPLAKSMHVDIVTASYATTIVIVFTGISPLILSPIANVYGRRPVFVLGSAIGVASHCASAAASTWTGVLVSRAFVGIGVSAGMGIGASVVADLFFMHERGFYMGIFLVFLTNGAHIAYICGGFIAKYLGWRWCFWISGMLFGATWLMILMCFPETLYHRNNATGQSLQQPQSWIKLFTFNGTSVRHRKLRLWDFCHVFLMLKYPSVVLPVIYYSIAFGIGTVLFGVTGAATFGPIYHFDPSQVGLAIGVSTSIGTLLGESLAGPVSDRILLLYMKKHGEPQMEARLQAIWPGFFLCPIGVIIEGVCLQYKTNWSGPVMGIAISSVGLQIISTNIYVYITDCYKPQSAEVSTLLNFGRQTFSFTLGFYMIPFAERTTYGIAWSVLAIIHMILFIGIIALMWKGRQWRDKLGAPDFHQDI